MNQPHPEESRDDQTREPETTPTQEWGERLDTGRTISRGGKEEGRVPGAEAQGPAREEPTR